AAKVEELDRLIAELQKRKAALLQTGQTRKELPPAPRPEAAETTQPAKPEGPTQPAPKTFGVRLKNELERTLDGLEWKAFKKKEGEWAFLRDREGRLIDELQSAKDFVDDVRKQGAVVVGKYRYQVSEDKFLNRYYAGGKAA
ncbi:MAG: hypothetical protein ACRD6W_16635, partial [Nitrososphaerales archaeon]